MEDNRLYMKCGNAGAWLGLLVFMAAPACSSGGQGTRVPDAGPLSPNQPDDAGAVAAGPADAAGGSICPAAAASVDLCKDLPVGTISACSRDASGQPSQTGYLAILSPDGSRKYVCANSWVSGGSGGYWFDHPDQFMTDPQSCCGANATSTAAPTAPQPAAGYLGSLHAPRGVKPQEMSQLAAGPLRQNPFAVVVTDSSGGAALSTALASWRAWAGDGVAHPAPDGSGAYYFPGQILINYVILETSGALAVVVVGPEVSPSADGSEPIGHPSLGGCAAGGGAPLVLIAGEVNGTTLTNHSGRFGHDPSVTPDALTNAAALFNCLGISITATAYSHPKP